MCSDKISVNSKLSSVNYEVMAPVGSRESLMAAIQAGADSIYFGIERLNMRAHSASTFTIDEKTGNLVRISK